MKNEQHGLAITRYASREIGFTGFSEGRAVEVRAVQPTEKSIQANDLSKTLFVGCYSHPGFAWEVGSFQPSAPLCCFLRRDSKAVSRRGKWCQFSSFCLIFAVVKNATWRALFHVSFGLATVI